MARIQIEVLYPPGDEPATAAMQKVQATIEKEALATCEGVAPFAGGCGGKMVGGQWQARIGLQLRLRDADSASGPAAALRKRLAALPLLEGLSVKVKSKA